MFNVDLSKMLHPRFWDLLPAFLPGLFFEACVVLGNPQLAVHMAKQTSMGPYPSALIAVVVAFVVGVAFMYWVQTVLIALKGAARLQTKLSGTKTRTQKDSQIADGAHQVWQKAAAQLLARRYGIQAAELSKDEWEALYAVLAQYKAEDVRGPLLVMTTHATGWGALAAALFAPGLRTVPFLLLACFLVATGLLTDLSRIAWWQKPASSDLAVLRNLLGAIPQPGPDQHKLES